MSRRLNPCRACAGLTRHDDRWCASCRRRRSRGETRLLLVPDRRLPSAGYGPTVEEIRGAVDLTRFVVPGSISWGGRGG